MTWPAVAFAGLCDQWAVIEDTSALLQKPHWRRSVKQSWTYKHSSKSAALPRRLQLCPILMTAVLLMYKQTLPLQQRQLAMIKLVRRTPSLPAAQKMQAHAQAKVCIQARRTLLRMHNCACAHVLAMLSVTC